jgi:hypothetical protein
VAYGFIQAKSGLGGAVTTLAIQYTSAVTTDNRAIAVCDGALTITYTCDDNASGGSNTYTEDQDFNDGVNLRSHMFSANLTRGGGSAITVTFHASATDNIAGIISEYSGLSTATGASAVDTKGTNSRNGAGTSYSATASPNPTDAGELAIMYVDKFDASTYTATSPAVTDLQAASQSGQHAIVRRDSVAGTTTVTATATANGGADHENLVVYKLAGPTTVSASMVPVVVANRNVGPRVLRLRFARQRLIQHQPAADKNTEFIWPTYRIGRRVGPVVLRKRHRLSWTDAATATTQFVELFVTATGTPSLIKMAGKVFAVTATGTATILNQPNKVLAVTATGTATLLKTAGKVLSVTATGTPTLLKTAGKVLSVTATGTASLINGVGKLLSVTATGTPTLLKTPWKYLTVTATGTPVLTVIKVAVVVLSVTATATVNFVMMPMKMLAVTATGTPSFIKRVARTLSVTATGTAVLEAIKPVVGAAQQLIFLVKSGKWAKRLTDKIYEELD